MRYGSNSLPHVNPSAVIAIGTLELQISKLQQERAALLKQMQGAERRDRLAELCRKQVW